MNVKRCPNCPHNHLEHATNPDGDRRCSIGWCPCRLLRKEVVEVGKAATIEVWPAPPMTVMAVS